MQLVGFVKNVCVLMAFGCAATPLTPASQVSSAAKPTPLILEKNEGERRVVRGWPGHPNLGETFILKVDPKNGASSHLVLLTADIQAGGAIDTHKHPGSDEILFFQSGTARVRLGDAVRVVHAGATVFIPADTWISVDNIGKEGISLVCVFSAPGFEDFMRAESALEGEKTYRCQKPRTMKSRKCTHTM